MNSYLRPNCASAARWLLVIAGIAAWPSLAAPILPKHDEEVLEVLPVIAGGRTDERQMRRRLAAQPRDQALALAVAGRYLDRARDSGDPRFAGLAMSAIDAWADDAAMPDGVLMMRATLQQYLHEFDASVASLQRLVARPGGQPQPQAWLTLATVRRVQGRYADSDAACEQVARVGAIVPSKACLAENAALRGEVDRARAVFSELLARAGNPDATRTWLYTSLAELEQRAGNSSAANSAFQTALGIQTDPYTTLAYADFLIEQKRPGQALRLLKAQPRSDAVLLRLAIAGVQGQATSAAADVAEMRERIALANQRPDAKYFHGREQAMFALAIDRDALRAFDLAHGNAARQREPLDLLVLMQAAHAVGDPAALRKARQLLSQTGLVDQRISALD